MAKKSQPLGDVDAAFDAAMTGMAQSLGPGFMFTCPEVVNVGIPLPALALRVLFHTNVFPLGRITQLAGEEGSCKSTFLSEISRWVLTRNGFGALAENEFKEYAELRNSVLWWDTQSIKRLKVVQTNHMEAWQQYITGTIATLKSLMDKHGKIYPCLLAVDSLMGTPPLAVVADIESTGHATKNYATAAYLATQYIRAFGSLTRGYPFVLVMTNHLKQKMADKSSPFMGGPTQESSGGKSAKYHETFEIWLRRVHDIRTNAYRGLRVEFKTHKSSFSASRDKIQADVLWWQDEHGRQLTMWDWHTASIEHLLHAGNTDAGGSAALGRAIDEVVPLESVNSRERTAVCRGIGLPDEDSPHPFRVIGEQLEHPNNYARMLELHKVLGIRQDVVLPVGEDYGDYLERAARESELRLQQQLVQQRQLAAALAQAPVAVAEPPAVDASLPQPSATAAADADAFGEMASL